MKPGQLRRHRPLPRGSGPRPTRLPTGNRARTPLPTVNVARKAKRAAEYKSFLSSAAWKRLRREALERAGHRCEAVRAGTFRMSLGGAVLGVAARCPETERLTAHHKTYARFGGDELPEDLEVRCKSCHDRHHALEGKRIA